jgi:hypothetical protein
MSKGKYVNEDGAALRKKCATIEQYFYVLSNNIKSFISYNELGYNELPVITNKFAPFSSPKSMFRP